MNGAAVGLDMGTVMAIGAARGVDSELLADVLPAVEAAIVNGLAEDGGAEPTDD